LPVEERPIGGLGIFLIKKIMDQVEYLRKDNRNFLMLTKNISV
jgi:serine/threonine-protein kinase RsbW